MLDINYSLKYESLFKKFSDDFLDPAIWTNPFKAPLVIFSDAKIEKYFKLKMIKDRKDSILMDFKTDKLEGMLFSALSAGFEHPEVRYERLPLQVLRNKILNKLISETSNGKYYYQTLDVPDIDEYLEKQEADGSKTINQNNLYTFSKNISQLYSEYIDSRNDEGFHIKWMSNSDGSFFDFSKLKDDDKKKYGNLEKWQKQIYRDLFSEDDASCTDGKDYHVKYVTLAQLVEINKVKNGGKLKFKHINDNIFLFGFNSMGQFYRSLLSQIAEDEKTKLHVYLQTNGIVSGDAENGLLKQWEKTGHDNFMLWSNLNPDSTTDASDGASEADGSKMTLLHELQKQLANDSYDNEKLKKIDSSDSSIVISGAPSALREVEALHSSICSIIRQNNDAKKPVNYSDFIVLSPDIEAYKVPVMQVFDSIEKDSSTDFPYIPYVFSDHSGEHSAVYEALDIFISILKQDSLNRADLFALLRNPVVKKARKISEDDLSAWSEWVINMNGFRNSEIRKDEWQTLTRRLAITTLTEGLFDDGTNLYKPYSDINSENADTLYKFIAAVDSLEKFRKDFAGKERLCVDDVEEISDFFAEWFKMPAEKDDYLGNERLVYSSMRGEIEDQKLLFKAGYSDINADSFFYSLKDNVTETKGSGVNMFVGGITFAKLTQNRTIPAKYVFILGLNSDCFPGTESESSLDLRKERKAGDDTAPEKNKEAFICQLMATGEKLYLSYVNKDLKKDAELFRSSVIDDLVYNIAGDMNGDKDAQKALIKEVESHLVHDISIDEDREWNELFTQRSFRNKINFSNIMSEENSTETSKDEKGGSQLPQKVRISDMKSFLANPFIFHAGQFFNTKDDETDENESEALEPISFGYLMKMGIFEDVITEAAVDSVSSVEDIIDRRFDDMKLENQIPDGIFGDVSKKQLKEQLVGTVEKLRLDPDFDFSGFKFGKTANVLIPMKTGDRQNDWILSGPLCAYCFNQAGNVLRVVDVVCSKELKTKHWLKPYLTAMAALAEKKDDVQCTVEIILVHNEKLEPFTLSRQFTSESATAVLRALYDNMYVDPFKKMVLINVLNDDNNGIKTDYKSFTSFMVEVEKDSGWQYFNQKELFNLYKYFGYDVGNFQNEYRAAVLFWTQLVPGLF